MQRERERERRRERMKTCIGHCTSCISSLSLSLSLSITAYPYINIDGLNMHTFQCSNTYCAFCHRLLSIYHVYHFIRALGLILKASVFPSPSIPLNQSLSPREWLLHTPVVSLSHSRRRHPTVSTRLPSIPYLNTWPNTLQDSSRVIESSFQGLIDQYLIIVVVSEEQCICYCYHWNTVNSSSGSERYWSFNYVHAV